MIDLTINRIFSKRYKYSIINKYIHMSKGKLIWRPNYPSKCYKLLQQEGKICDRCGKVFKTPWDHKLSLCLECETDLLNSERSRWIIEDKELISKKDCLLFFVDNKEGIIKIWTLTVAFEKILYGIVHIQNGNQLFSVF